MWRTPSSNGLCVRDGPRRPLRLVSPLACEAEPFFRLPSPFGPEPEGTPLPALLCAGVALCVVLVWLLLLRSPLYFHLVGTSDCDATARLSFSTSVLPQHFQCTQCLAALEKGGPGSFATAHCGKWLSLVHYVVVLIPTCARCNNYRHHQANPHKKSFRATPLFEMPLGWTGYGFSLWGNPDREYAKDPRSPRRLRSSAAAPVG